MAAYAFSRFNFRLKRTLFTGILFGQVFPWIVLINPLFVAFATMHLINSYVGMILTYTAFTIPFSVYMLVGYLVTVPKSLDEAAVLDGASRWQVIWLIICPVMLPGFRRHRDLRVPAVLDRVSVCAGLPDPDRTENAAPRALSVFRG